MKKVIFVIFVALIIVSCGQTQEDKAIAKIKGYIEYNRSKNYFELIEFKLDSAFAPNDDPLLNYKVIKYLEVKSGIQDLELIIKQAKASMSYWDESNNSSFGKNEYIESQNEYNKANSKLNEAREEEQLMYNEISKILSESHHHYIGNLATFLYRYTNLKGDTIVAKEVCFMDSCFNRIEYVNKFEEYNQIQAVIKQIQE